MMRFVASKNGSLVHAGNNILWRESDLMQIEHVLYDSEVMIMIFMMFKKIIIINNSIINIINNNKRIYIYLFIYMEKYQQL